MSRTNEISEEFMEQQKKLKKENDKIYREPIKTDIITKDEKHGGHTKTKVLEKCTYKNGVVKTRLVGLLKDGKIQWGRTEKLEKKVNK